MDEGAAAEVRERPTRERRALPERRSPRPHRRPDTVFGAVMVALWVAWLVLTSLTQPKLVTPEQLSADLDAGRVVTWQTADLTIGADDSWTWSADIEVLPTSPGTDDVTTMGSPVLAYWVDGIAGRTRVLDPSTLEIGTGPSLERLESSGVPRLDRYPDPSITIPRERNWTVWASLPLLLMFLGSVLAGPAPTRGTRWFWFWLAWATLGVGVLAYAVWEQLRPAPPPGHPGAVARRRGWVGAVVAVGVSLLVAAAAFALADATHWLWVVRP